MSEHPSGEGLDAEIARMLRRFEGPKSPQPRRPRRRSRRVVALVVGSIVLVAVVAIVATAVIGGGGGRETAVGPAHACRVLELGGRAYAVRRVPAVTVGPAIGEGSLRCGNSTLRVAVARIAGIDARDAVVRVDAPRRVYVAGGACIHRTGAALLACLRIQARTP